MRNGDAPGETSELRELSSTDLKFLEDGLDSGKTTSGGLCDLDTILDGFQADPHLLLTNPDQLLKGQYSNHSSHDLLRSFHSLHSQGRETQVLFLRARRNDVTFAVFTFLSLR